MRRCNLGSHRVVGARVSPNGARLWSDVMTLGKIFGILIFSSLAATGATLAGGISKNLANWH